MDASEAFGTYSGEKFYNRIVKRQAAFLFKSPIAMLVKLFVTENIR